MINKHARYNRAAFIARGLKTIFSGKNYLSRWQSRHRHFFDYLREKFDVVQPSRDGDLAASDRQDIEEARLSVPRLRKGRDRGVFFQSQSSPSASDDGAPEAVFRRDTANEGQKPTSTRKERKADRYRQRRLEREKANEQAQ